MSPELSELISRLHQELDQIESETKEGLSIIRSLLAGGDDKDDLNLVNLYAVLSNTLLFQEITRRRIDDTLLDLEDCSPAIFQAAGEDLSELLGRVIDTKIMVTRIATLLKEL